MRGLKMKRPSARRGESDKAVVLVDGRNNTTGFEIEEVDDWLNCQIDYSRKRIAGEHHDQS